MLLASQPPPQIIRAKPQLRVLPLPSQSPQSSPFVRPLQIVAGPNHATSGSSRNCLLAARARMFAVVLSIGAGSMFLVSLDSVVDNLIPVARKYLTELYGSEAEADVAWSWVVSARVYGLAFGCFCAFLLSNCNSRKKPLMASFVINLVGGGLSALICMPGCGIQIACLGRFLSGIGSGLAHIIGAAMLAEIPPIRSRGQALASLTVWACLGELAGMFLSLDSVLGTARTWHLALGFPVLIIPVALIFLAAAPDSPRALLMSGQEEKAFQSLQFYQKSEDWIASLKDIKQELAKQQENGNARRNSAGQERRPLLRTAQQQRGKGRLLLGSRFVSGKFVRPLLLGAFVLTFAHLDDWLWISYSTQAFENAGLPTAAAQRASLWMSLPQALISLALLFHFDGFPRRQLLILPTLGSILCSLAAICALRLADGGGMAKTLLPCLAALDLCNAAVASESAYSVVPELFPQRDRVMGTALIGILQNLFGGLLTTMALPLMNSHGTEFVLIPFALMNLVYIAVIVQLLPETCGRTFHEISENFSDQLPALFANPVQCLRAAPTMLVNGLRKCVLQTTGCLKR